MQILVVLSQKGGCGKTTLAGHIAVQAQSMGAGPVGLLDADPQESLAEWRRCRRAETPLFAQTTLWRLKADVDRMGALGVELLVVDTPPGITATIRGAVDLADLVVIPAKPSPHDLRAVGKTVALVEGRGKPVVFVINCASSRARITSDAAVALSQHGTLAPTVVHQRADFASSMIDGRTVMEIARGSPSAVEVAQLWDYLSARLNHEPRTFMTPFRLAAAG